jgi:hypothetical protein
MDIPVNAAYGKGDAPPDKPQARTFLGMWFPGEQVWMITAAIASAMFILALIVLVLVPSGFPYLAAKNADGFAGYIAYFFMYMMGFFILVAAAVAAVLGVMAAVNRA